MSDAVVDSRCQSVEWCHQHLGWSFLPLAGKQPLKAGWPTRARESLAEALAWAKAGNIGVRAGKASGGLVIIDVDVGADLAPLQLPPTVTAVTGSGGRHYFFQTQHSVRNSVGRLAPKIDVRSDGGQVVFAGSIHPDTKQPYRWLEGHEPWSIELAMLPDEIVEQLVALAKPRVSAAPKPPAPRTRPLSSGRLASFILRSEVQAVARAVDGQRNDALNKAAFTLGRLVGGGSLDRDEVERELEAAGARVGLSPSEIRNTIASGLKSGIAEPRELTEPEPSRPTSPAKRPPKPPAAAPGSASAGERPNILIDTEEHRVVGETIAALTADPGIFQRGGILARVIRDEQPQDGILRADGSPTIQTMPPANLRERMTRCATFSKLNRKGEEISAHPAAWLVSAVDARGEWPGIRPLMGVSDAPILRADGSVWQTPGYDPHTGVLFEPARSAEFPAVHPDAGLDDADAAAQRLLGIVCDFPFESPEHRAAWLAALLTPLARFAFGGPSPLFLIDANVRGAGKGLLAQTIGRIVLGREMPVSSYAHESAEMRKKITAIAIAGDRVILLDNLEGMFGNDALDRALTSTWWKDRILGKSEEVELPLIPTWYATGNNVQVAADTTRRIIHVRMDVLAERPEERTGFKHPNLLSWISNHRGALLADALTILSAYCRSGRPTHGLTPFGSFEGWSALVREAVVWVGLPDPCLTRTKLAEASDTTVDALTQLIAAWREYDAFGQGLMVSELLAKLYPQERQYGPTDAASVAMRTALENLVGCPPGRVPTPKQVGNKLRHYRRRVVGGCFIDLDPQRNKHGMTWRLYGAR